MKINLSLIVDQRYYGECPASVRRVSGEARRKVAGRFVLQVGGQGTTTATEHRVALLLSIDSTEPRAGEECLRGSVAFGDDGAKFGAACAFEIVYDFLKGIRGQPLTFIR